jgi:hypothetical protein
MESNAATHQNFILAPPSPIKRKPPPSKNGDTSRPELHSWYDQGLASSPQDENTTPSMFAADLQPHNGKSKCQTTGHPTEDLEEDESAPHLTDEKTGFTTLAQDWWLMELMSLMLSLAAIVAIFAVLRAFENHSLPGWPFNITLNTFLALFTTIANTGLIVAVLEALSQLKWIWFMKVKRPLADFQTYDEACRGGVVSGFKLLCTLRAR